MRNNFLSIIFQKENKFIESSIFYRTSSSSKLKSSCEFKNVDMNGEDLDGHLNLYELSDLQPALASTGSSKLFQIFFATLY